jgi:hypothetical protein
VQDKFPDDVSGPTAAPETSSKNVSCTPCKIPKTKNHKDRVTQSGNGLDERDGVRFLAGAPPSLVFDGFFGAISPEVKWPKREANHSSSFSTTVKNA